MSKKVEFFSPDGMQDVITFKDGGGDRLLVSIVGKWDRAYSAISYSELKELYIFLKEFVDE